MKAYSTRDAAKKLGIAMSTLSRHIRLKKVRTPKSVTSGGMTIHLWTEAEIEHVRQLLPKIANGRKTRHQKLRERKKDAQPGAAVPHKSRKLKK
jgi:hypothetical protein